MESLYHISWRSIKSALLSGHFTLNKICQTQGGGGGKSGDHQNRRLHPLGTMNVLCNIILPIHPTDISHLSGGLTDRPTFSVVKMSFAL